MFSNQNHQARGKMAGVSCTVGNCSYHGTGNCCLAGTIKVGTEYALDKTETFCSTFTAKK